MAYSEDLRQRVWQYVANGSSKAQASRLFGVSRTAIYRWLNDDSLRKKLGRTKPDKLNQPVVGKVLDSGIKTGADDGDGQCGDS